MSEGQAVRLAHNEAMFREVNERIEAGQWPGEADVPAAFRCECARLGCNLLLEVTPSAYENVRAHPRRFVLVPGHELASIESVVHRCDAYVVVEKQGVAGAVAEQLDVRE